MSEKLLTDFVKTPYGKFELTVSKRGLVKIDFPASSLRGGQRPTKQSEIVILSEAKNLDPSATPQDDKQYLSVLRNDVLRRAKSVLKKYFSGFPIKSNQIPIDWTIFRSFDQCVLKELLKVKPGKMTTYGELARKSHFPRAARAVGNALNRNPIPILIPCHRVLRKDSSLGGYRGGSKWKRLLLKIDRFHSN